MEAEGWVVGEQLIANCIGGEIGLEGAPSDQPQR